MSLRNLLRCDTAELEDLLTKWTENEGWEFENFADFLELVGLTTPVELSELDEKNKSFKCCTADGREVLISLRFGDGWDWCSEINVIYGEEIKNYLVNYNVKRDKTVPKATLKNRIIKSGKKELKSFYCEDFCRRTLKIDDMHTLEIEINEPAKIGKTEILVLKNSTEIENYLMGLDNTLVIAKVYDTVMKLLEFTDEDIFNSKKILFVYRENVDKEERTLSKILLEHGGIQESAIPENGETFHIFRDGSWRYYSDGIRIFYLKEKEHYVFSITGAEENIITANPSEILIRVKEKISELFEII